MNNLEDIGLIVNKLRKEKKITLKELSERTGLSTGFLSQFERGMTTIAVDSLLLISNIFDVELDIFFQQKKINKKPNKVIRGFEREVSLVNSDYIQYNLISNIKEAEFLPRIYNIMPSRQTSEAEKYPHEGVEFLYVIEGILTLHIQNNTYELFPEDSIYMDSTIPHNWENHTNKVVKVLTINSPNPYKNISK